MKSYKKILGLILTFAFVIGMLTITSIPVEAKDYTYQIKLLLGNNEHAYFDEDGIDSLKDSGYEVEYPVTRKSDQKQLTNQLIIKGLKYDSTVSIDVDSLIKINNEEAEANATQYYVKGLRVSGADNLVEMNEAKVATLSVKGDESYVVAYGVGATIPYTVRYVDKDENPLLDDDTLYAAEGEIIFVPARHISGYKPDALYKTASKGLKKDTVFTFVYTKGEPTIIYNEKVVDEVTNETVDGGTDYDYEYQYVDGGTTTVTHHNGTSSSTVHQDGGTTEGTVNNRQEVVDNTNNTDADVDVEAADEGDDGTTITDSDTPTDVIDIDEEDPVKAGGTREKLLRNMIIGIIIAIIAVISILVTLYVAERKRKREIVKVQNNKKNNE